MSRVAEFEAPHPGSKKMPAWTTGELVDAPLFTWRNWFGMIGPGLVMGAAAIGGGEWMAGPAVTAKYGGCLLWVATISILVQVVYNIEISRYTLYTGEPIFTGIFRTLPGPGFWLVAYLLLDWGSLFPYLAVNAAVPLESMLVGRGFDPAHIAAHWWMHKFVATGIYIATIIPLLLGGKIYNSLKTLMSAKLVIVFGFLLVTGILFSRPASWIDIISGFFKIGTVPVVAGEDRNGNGVLDPGEDFDRDGRLDVVEVPEVRDEQNRVVPGTGDLDGDGKLDGPNTDNLFSSVLVEGRWPNIDLTLIAFIAGLAAIAGNGGLTNTPISNFTRDVGWGMGRHVGAIPSMIGGRGITLSHVGCVFEVNDRSLPRWKRWVRHVRREQLFVWMGACFVGVALPSILSVEFLPRGTAVDQWKVAAMTADGVESHVSDPQPGVLADTPLLRPYVSGPSLGLLFRWGTLICGFLVLTTSMVSTMDGFVRRWVDVMWTASPRLRKLKTSAIRYVYFGVLMGYCLAGLSIIWITEKPGVVFQIATTGYNFAFAISCWHTLAICALLMPAALRPGWPTRVAMFLGACFFFFLGIMATLKLAGIV